MSSSDTAIVACDQYSATAVCLALMARDLAFLTAEIVDAFDDDDEEADDSDKTIGECDDEDEQQALDAMLFSASTDDEQAEWMEEGTIHGHTNTPATDDEYDGSITPTPSRSSSLSHHPAARQHQLPFHSIAADRRQLCNQHGDDCPSNHTQQSRAAIVTTTPRHVTSPSDSAHQQLVNTLTSPAAKFKRHWDFFLSPPTQSQHHRHSSSNKENVSPGSSLRTPQTHPPLKTSPQSAFSAVSGRTPPPPTDTSPLTPTSSSAALNSAAVSKRRKIIHASLTRSFQSLPVEQQPSRGGSGSGCGGSMESAAVGRHRMPR